ncbi:unnamed protein product [marine sediment metagenome]|uniref:Uncharacterized protein n=1 Tax=marine sediment metagenome TaxID=412755 RepID=X1ALJ5_9ZZZZ
MFGRKKAINDAPEARLEKSRVLKNFILECENARKEPIDLRLILFEDPKFSNAELISAIQMLASRRVKADPVYTKAQMTAVEMVVDQTIVELEKLLKE